MTICPNKKFGYNEDIKTTRTTKTTRSSRSDRKVFIESMDAVFNLQLYVGIFFASLMTLLGVWLYEGLNYRFPKWVDLLQGLSAGMLLAVIFFGIIPEATEILAAGFAQCQI